MIRGLRITIRGAELRDKLAERIRIHEAAIVGLEARIRRRGIDWSFAVGSEDFVKTIDALEYERQRCVDRLISLTLLRDSIVAEEVYALDKADLRLAELIPSPRSHPSPLVDGESDRPDKTTIDGLKLTIPGDELRGLLEQRIDDHQRRADRWQHEQARTPEHIEDAALVPAVICTHQAARHTWRAEVLEFIRDHVDATKVYRLDEDDSVFAELLPEPPWQ